MMGFFADVIHLMVIFPELLFSGFLNKYVYCLVYDLCYFTFSKNMK